MIITKVTTKKLEKNPNTKTTYNEIEQNTSFMLADNVEKYFVDSMRFFKNLGGKESLQRAYTIQGYSPTLLTSISPDKQNKTIRKFNYINLTRFYGKRITRFIDIKTKLYYGFKSKNGDGVTLFETPKKATKTQLINNY